MPDLIALDLPSSDNFVLELRRAWDNGDAVLPIDQRLPTPARADLVDRLGATAVVDASGRTNRTGWPAETGDAVVVATSGTTGDAKGVILTHSAMTASAEITSSALAADPATDRWLACLPLAHIGGLSVVTRAVLTDTPLTVLESFEAQACEEAARGGATLVSLVVTALRRIDATLFRTILLGGSAIPVDRPGNTVATYGMTETGSGIVYEGYPLEGVELAIADGEVLVKSPTLMRGYRDGTTIVDSAGWLRTGDAGELERDGRLRVHGRMGDVIVTGGEKVWPVQVERVMETLAWVAEAAVVGRPDAEWGNAVTAYVVPTRGAQPPALADLRDELSENLPRYALPRDMVIATELPRTALGKIRRADLSAETDPATVRDE